MYARQLLMGIFLLPVFGCEPAESEDSLARTETSITITDRLYEIRSASSGKCLTVDQASQADGAPVVQLTCSGKTNQRWQLQRKSDGTFAMKAQHSNLCMAVASNSATNGLLIVQSACGGANKQWQLVDDVDAIIARPQTSGSQNRKCLDLSMSSPADNAPIIQWSCSGLTNQRWMFAPADGQPDTGGGSGGNPMPAPGGSTVNYTVDSTTIFANPERGFYHHQETSGGSTLSASQLSGYRSEGISLILRLFYLSSFRTTSISSSYLSSMTTDFARLREAGLKAVVRFAYTSSMSKPYGDASASRVLAHIQQLKPVLQANADVIATVQVGFVGAWGEWYYTDYFGDENNISSSQMQDRKAVVDALLDVLPTSRTVQLRTPAFKKGFFGSAALSSTEAFSGSDKSRVGHHNDCFVASSDDLGTYGNITADKAYLAAENLYVPQGGETCATSSLSGWANASADMEKLHYSYLNRDYLGAVYTSWGSNLDVARRRLGYRLALTSGSFDGGARPGGELKLSLSVRNDGYAAPFNPRNVEIIARHQTTGARLVAKLTADPRRFAPGTTQRIDARLCVAAGTPEGTYALSLALPDPEPTLHDRPEYAIRLANSGLWDATTGSNNLQQSIIISASQPATTCGAGSVQLVRM